jgi:hypothetical protein
VSSGSKAARASFPVLVAASWVDRSRSAMRQSAAASFRFTGDYWKSPEYAAIHDAHRQEAIQRRRAYEEQEQEKLS